MTWQTTIYGRITWRQIYECYLCDCSQWTIPAVITVAISSVPVPAKTPVKTTAPAAMTTAVSDKACEINSSRKIRTDAWQDGFPEPIGQKLAGSGLKCKWSHTEAGTDNSKQQIFLQSTSPTHSWWVAWPFLTNCSSQNLLTAPLMTGTWNHCEIQVSVKSWIRQLSLRLKLYRK